MLHDPLLLTQVTGEGHRQSLCAADHAQSSDSSILLYTERPSVVAAV
jgi:hypothetical protein